MPKYKGHEIELTWDGRIVCEGLSVEGSTWAEVTKAIDSALKIEYEKIPALFHDYHKRQITECIVTRPQGQYRVWITVGKKRETVDGDSVYLDTPENRTALTRIIERLKEIDKEERALDEELKDIPRAKPQRKQ